MLRFVARRLVSMVFVLFSISVLVVPDLLRDARRRPGGADRRAERRPGDAARGAQGLRARQAAARAATR